MPIILTGRTGWRSSLINPNPERMGGRFATPEFSHLWNYLALGCRLVKHPYNIIGGKNATWDLAPGVGAWGPLLTQSDNLSVDFVYNADYSFGPYPWSLCLVMDTTATPTANDIYCCQLSGAFNVASEWTLNVAGGPPADHRIQYFTTATQSIVWNDDQGMVTGRKIICISRDGDGVWRLWINGLYYGTVTEPATPTAVAGFGFTIGARIGGTASNLNGDYYAAYIWKNYALNHADAALLTRDPFGLLTQRRRLWVPVQGAAAAGGQTAIVGGTQIIAHAPAVITAVGGVSRTINAGPVVLHAPAVITVPGGISVAVAAASVVAHAPPVVTTASITRTVSAASLVAHAPAVSTSVGGVTRTISAGPVVVHAPAVVTTTGALTRVIGAASLIAHAPPVTASVAAPGAQTSTVSAATVVVHAPAVATTVGGITRAINAAALVAHAPQVSTTAALTRVIGATGVVVHAPAVSTSIGTATRTVSAAPLVVHAPQVATAVGGLTRTIGSAVTVIHAPAVTASITFSQTKAITSASMILHAPAVTAYALLYPVPPLGAAADDLRQAVAVDDLRTAVSVDNLSASVSLY